MILLAGECCGGGGGCGGAANLARLETANLGIGHRELRSGGSE